MMTSLPTLASKAVEKIEIFTLDAYPIAHEDSVFYCNLDQLKHLEKAIQDNAERLITHPEMLSQYNQSLTEAYQCRYQATAYHLKFLPAVVINQSHVAYGCQSLKEALNNYEINHD